MFAHGAWDTVMESRPILFAVTVVVAVCAYAGAAAAMPAAPRPVVVAPGSSGQSGLTVPPPTGPVNASLTGNPW